MVIIYSCFGSAHSSVLAAAIHTNMLPVDRIPETGEIINLPYYDKTPSDLIGTPFYFGKDERGNFIYILGTGKARQVIENMLKSFINLEGLEGEVIIKNTLQYVNVLVRVGGYLSRRLGLVFPGRLMTVYGLKKVYPDFVEVVKKVKEEIGIAYK